MHLTLSSGGVWQYKKGSNQFFSTLRNRMEKSVDSNLPFRQHASGCDESSFLVVSVFSFSPGRGRFSPLSNLNFEKREIKTIFRSKVKPTVPPVLSSRWEKIKKKKKRKKRKRSLLALGGGDQARPARRMKGSPSLSLRRWSYWRRRFMPNIGSKSANLSKRNGTDGSEKNLKRNDPGTNGWDGIKTCSGTC